MVKDKIGEVGSRKAFKYVESNNPEVVFELFVGEKPLINERYKRPYTKVYELDNGRYLHRIETFSFSYFAASDHPPRSTVVIGLEEEIDFEVERGDDGGLDVTVNKIGIDTDSLYYPSD